LAKAPASRHRRATKRPRTPKALRLSQHFTVTALSALANFHTVDSLTMNEREFENLTQIRVHSWLNLSLFRHW
jgi:hypothetical protein